MSDYNYVTQDEIYKNEHLITEKVKEIAEHSSDKKLGQIVLKLIKYNELRLEAWGEDDNDLYLKVQVFGDELLKELDKAST